MATYKISELDQALDAILGGNRATNMLQSSVSRPLICELAAAKCFTEQRPEDSHSAILRVAMLDLKKGSFMNAEWNNEDNSDPSPA